MNWKVFLSVLVFMVILDFLWIGLAANRFYVEQFGSLGRIEDGKFQVVLWAAIAVYVLMALSVSVFALPQVSATDPWWKAAILGGVLGLCIYGVYDFTNHATLREWPLALMAVDITWGTFLTAATTVMARWIRG